MEEFEGHWCLELVPMWSHPHPNPLPKGEGDLDPFVAGSVRGDWAFRRLRLPWIVARGPSCGQAPALHLSYSILGCRCYEDGGRWKSSRVIGASSSCRCGLTLTPTLSQKERAIWTLLLPVQFGAIGHFAGFGNPGLSRVALPVGKPQRYISLIRFSAVVATRMVVGGRVRGSLVPRARADVVTPSPQPSPKRRGRFRSFCCRFSSGRLGISPASAILDCRAWPWLWASPSATSLYSILGCRCYEDRWSVSPAGVGIEASRN